VPNTEKEKFGLTIDIAAPSSGSSALVLSLGVRATSLRDSHFPGWRISSFVHNPMQSAPPDHISSTPPP